MNIDKKKLINKENKSFCTAPWRVMQILPDFNITPCCIYNEPMIFNNLSILEFYNRKNLNNLRLNMLNGILNEKCLLCNKLENANIGSMRTMYNNANFNLNEIIQETNEDGSLKKLNIKILDLKLSNKCNFKCRDCSSYLSSSWMIEENNQNLSNIKMNNIISKYDKENIEFLNIIKNLDSITLAGGESIIIDEHYDIMDYLLENNRNDINLTFITNLSTLHYKGKYIVDYWKKFKKIFIIISFDDLYKRGEYFRKGLNFENLVNNIKEVQNNYSNACIGIICTINIYNIYYLPEIFKFILDNNLININYLYINYVYDPIYLSITILPLYAKKIIENKLLNSINKINNKYPDECLIYQSIVKKILDFMNSEDISDKFEKFKEYTVKMDKIRNESFIEVFPEIGFLLD